jgi:hypothetical protein
MDIFLALVHFPCLNRRGEVVATALTNVDLHDLSRSGRTFGVQGVYIVTPVELQQRMVEEILGHWTRGKGAEHVRRAEAMSRVHVEASIQSACEDIERRTGRAPVLAVTGAQMREPTETFTELRDRIRTDAQQAPELRAPPLLIVFGTGWGLAPEVIDAADVRLPPIGRDPELEDTRRYNHLSVRAAVAISLDRLLGDR